jgi:type I restriction enzyme, S subunit
VNDECVESPNLAICVLGDIAEVRLGKTPRKADYRSDGEFKIIKFRDILENGEIDWDNSDKGFVAATPESLTGLRELQVGDVLVTASAHMSEHIGKKAALVKSVPSRFKEAFVVGEILQIRLKQDVDPRWVLNYVRSRDGYRAIQKKVHGVHLIATRAREIEVPVADFRAQQRLLGEIEKQFSRLDKATESFRRLSANVRRCRANIIADTFPKPSDGRSAGWRWEKLTTLGELARGKSKHRPRDDPKLYGGPYPFIQTGDVRASNGRIRKFTQTYSEAGLKQSRLWPKGTLCITIAANIAETGILEFDACFPDSVVGFRIEDLPAVVKYVELYIRTVRGKLDRLASATAQKNINLDVLSRIEIPFPVGKDIASLVADVERRLSLLEEIEDQITTNLSRVERLRQATLSRMFSLR